MATTILKTVKPSGGDYSTLVSALADVPASLIATDEQWNIEISTFSGGLSGAVTMPTITSDATRYLEIRAAAGDEYNPVDDTGIFLTASAAFAGVLVNNVTHFCRLRNIGVKNTRTAASGRGIDWAADDGLTEGLFATTLSTSGAILYFFNNAQRHVIRECLSHLGTTGFDFGNNDPRTADKLTSIDASAVGIDTGTAATTITNSLSIGSSNPWLGTFQAASSNNASDGTDAPGSGSVQNITTADLANYAGGDFRTASGSVLATAGTVDFIGYALETSSGITITGTSVPTQTEADIVTGGKTIILTLAGDTFVTGTSSEDGIAGGSDSDIAASGTNWDSLIKTALDNTDVVLSVGDTVATITLPAFGTYDIPGTETITWTIPAASLTTGTSDNSAPKVLTLFVTSGIESLSKNLMPSPTAIQPNI